MVFQKPKEENLERRKNLAFSFGIHSSIEKDHFERFYHLKEHTFLGLRK